jgi:putative FmdB family regulatory protein
MQLYNFRCQDCDHVFEAWDTMEKTSNPPCPECDALGAVRLISSPRLDYTGMATSGNSSDDAFTTSIDRWAKARRKQVAIEKRNLERHGTYD